MPVEHTCSVTYSYLSVFVLLCFQNNKRPELQNSPECYVVLRMKETSFVLNDPNWPWALNRNYDVMISLNSIRLSEKHSHSQYLHFSFFSMLIQLQTMDFTHNRKRLFSAIEVIEWLQPLAERIMSVCNVWSWLKWLKFTDDWTWYDLFMWTSKSFRMLT